MYLCAQMHLWLKYGHYKIPYKYFIIKCILESHLWYVELECAWRFAMWWFVGQGPTWWLMAGGDCSDVGVSTSVVCCQPVYNSDNSLMIIFIVPSQVWVWVHPPTLAPCPPHTWDLSKYQHCTWATWAAEWLHDILQYALCTLLLLVTFTLSVCHMKMIAICFSFKVHHNISIDAWDHVSYHLVSAYLRRV